MKITLRPELEKRIAEKVERDEAGTANAFVEEALHFYLDYDEREMDEAEYCETKAAIDETIEQGERGEGRPAEQVFADLRTKYGVSR